MRILIVNDTQTTLTLLSWFLTNEGHSVIEAENGQVAVDIVREEVPELILMDISMPIMNGFEATRAIRDLLDGKPLPIIFLSANSDQETKDRCIESGGNGFLETPVKDDILINTINGYQ